MSGDPNQAAADLLKNNQFMQLFQRALGGGGGDGADASAKDFLAGMPKEGDPKRDAWLRDLQDRLQQESVKEAKKELEQVHSDDQGQWMYILPEPGFCVKCTTSGGGKVFINVCQHERIGEPVPMESADDDEEVRFRIPLSCGHARPDSDKKGTPCKVYDVIVNPATIKRCAGDSEFRRFVAALCMQWIKQKSEPTLNADEFRNLNFKAKGKLEPQRIRLSTAPKATNAMQDEIKLPSSGQAPTAPSHPSGSTGSGKLIEEVDRPLASSSNSGGAAPANAVASGREERIVLTSSEEGAAKAKVEPTDNAALVVEVRKEGSYDWSSHKKPFQNVFFRETVPASYYVEMFIPNIQTIREVDVRVGAKKVECYYIDEDDEGATVEPFLAVVFEYPIAEDISDAKFVRKTSRLRMRFTVRLPDETDDSSRTVASRDATELEEEEERRLASEREAKWAEEQARVQKQRAAEEQVMAERKSYVENLSAVQSGDIPPMLKEEIDAIPKEQLPSMLGRLEGKVRMGDSIDELFEKLPEPVLEGLIAYIRERLSLAPRPSTSTNTAAKKKSVKFAEDNNTIINEGSAPKKGAEDKKPAPAATSKPTEEDDSRVVYNYAEKSEKLFGVAFHNRYLFSLDN